MTVFRKSYNNISLSRIYTGTVDGKFILIAFAHQTILSTSPSPDKEFNLMKEALTNLNMEDKFSGKPIPPTPLLYYLSSNSFENKFGPIVEERCL